MEQGVDAGVCGPALGAFHRTPLRERTRAYQCSYTLLSEQEAERIQDNERLET